MRSKPRSRASVCAPTSMRPEAIAQLHDYRRNRAELQFVRQFQTEVPRGVTKFDRSIGGSIFQPERAPGGRSPRRESLVGPLRAARPQTSSLARQASRHRGPAAPDPLGRPPGPDPRDPLLCDLPRASLLLPWACERRRLVERGSGGPSCRSIARAGDAGARRRGDIVRGRRSGLHRRMLHTRLTQRGFHAKRRAAR